MAALLLGKRGGGQDEKSYNAHFIYISRDSGVFALLELGGGGGKGNFVK